MTTVTGRVLRPYQLEAVDAVKTAWGQGISRPAVVLPTGTGKSTVIAGLATYARDAGYRVILLAHRGELLRQMADSVQAVDPAGEPVGILQAETREYDRAIVAASFQTVATGGHYAALGTRDVVLVDEAHHAPAETYRAAMEALGCFSGQAWTCGFTATMDRADGGLGEVWEEVVYEKDLRWAIGAGYLVAPRGLTVVLPDLDLTSVKTVAGDFQNNALEEAMASSVDTTVTAIQHHAGDRAGIVFAAGVDHALALADALQEKGMAAAAVTGDMVQGLRESFYADFHDGRLQFLVTVQVLTEGADFPRCDAAIMARPTQSQTLYTQMVGRALRPYPGKTDALVLDLTGITRHMSLATLTNLDPKAETKRVAPDSDEDPGQEEPKEKAGRRFREGVVDFEETNLLELTKGLRWLRTPAGTLFLQCGRDWLVFVWPVDEGTGYRVGYMRIRGPREGDWLSPPFRDVETAMDVAAEKARAAGLEVPLRAASQYRSVPPSEAQLRFAENLEIEGAANMTRARLSDEISIQLAARRLDF